MKKWAWALLGLFLAVFGVVAALHGVFGVLVGVACALGAWRSFRAAGRAAPAVAGSEKSRPWER